MSKLKICSTFWCVCFLSQLAYAVDYVDLDSYNGKTCHKPVSGGISAWFEDNWNSIVSSANESVFADNVSSEKFWNFLHESLRNGSFFNFVSNYRAANNQTGGDLFLKSVYASIDQATVRYRSVSPRGDSITLSGKIFLPKKKNAKNIIIASHYTICANSEAPSNANSIEGIFATKDYIVLMPDYIGYGISDSLTHPYLHLESEVSSTIDMLKSALHYLRANCYTFSPSLILIGYSQGGAATIALQKKIEEEYEYQFPIQKVFAGGGPYKLSETFDYYLNCPTTEFACALPMIILGMNYGENLGLNPNDFFTPYLQEKYQKLVESKAFFANDVNAELGTDMKRLLQPIIFQKESCPTSSLYEAVRKNSIAKWKPKSPLYLFHSTEDDVVPFLNSKLLETELESFQTDNVQFDFAPYGNHMHAAITFFEKVYHSL